MKGLTVEDMLTLLATCAPTARILVETNSAQKKIRPMTITAK